jgi:hypothetical protein
MNGGGDALGRYLAELRGELKARGVDDAGDLPDEIRSHVLEATREDDSEAAVSRALDAFGTPARLAASVASERAAGAIDSGPQRAPVAHRLFGGLLDILWIAGIPTVLGVASSRGWMRAADLLLGLSHGQRQPLPALFGGPDAMITAALTIGALVWLIPAIRATVRALRAGRPTVGMRVAGLTIADLPDGRIAVRASDALALGVAPVTRRGWAITGVVLTGLLVALAIAVAAAPSLFASLWGHGWTDEVVVAQDYCREAVRMAYAAALSRDQDAASGLREMFASSNMSFDDFARGLETDGIRTNTEGGYGYRADDASATIEVGALEWAAAKSVMPAYRQVFFRFERDAGDPSAEWTLVNVARDPLGRAGGNGPSGEEARGLVERLLGEAGTPAADRMTDGTEIMTESFAVSDAARPLLRTDWTAPAFDRGATIDSIEFVDRYALVTTTEWWLPEGAAFGSAPATRFVYRVLLSRGAPLADGREPAK